MLLELLLELVGVDRTLVRLEREDETAGVEVRPLEGLGFEELPPTPRDDRWDRHLNGPRAARVLAVGGGWRIHPARLELDPRRSRRAAGETMDRDNVGAWTGLLCLGRQAFR